MLDRIWWGSFSNNTILFSRGPLKSNLQNILYSWVRLWVRLLAKVVILKVVMVLPKLLKSTHSTWSVQRNGNNQFYYCTNLIPCDLMPGQWPVQCWADRIKVNQHGGESGQCGQPHTDRHHVAHNTCQLSPSVSTVSLRSLKPGPVLQVRRTNRHMSLLSLLFRSNFPEEFGSCQANEHCSQPTAPYCSAFGYCTQVRHLLDTFRVMWRRDRSRGTDTMDVSPVNNTQPTRINKPESKLNVNTSILYLFLYLIKIHNRLQLSY